MKTYIGVSSLRFHELQELFDITPQTEGSDGRSYFERVFGASFIRPGEYEIYDKEFYRDHDFSREFLQRLFPFDVTGDLDLWNVDLGPVSSVFFLQNEGEIVLRGRDDIKITDVLDIE